MGQRTSVLKFYERRGLHCVRPEQEGKWPLSSSSQDLERIFDFSCPVNSGEFSRIKRFPWKSTVYLFKNKKWTGKSGPHPACFLRERFASAKNQRLGYGRSRSKEILRGKRKESSLRSLRLQKLHRWAKLWQSCREWKTGRGQDGLKALPLLTKQLKGIIAM